MKLPSASQYRTALDQIQGQISPLQLQLLKSHYLAPNHIARSEEIALAANKDWQVTNLHYGRLGAVLRGVLGHPLREGEQQSSIIASFHRRTKGCLCRWEMHKQLASAIRSLNWFDPEDVGPDALSDLGSDMPDRTRSEEWSYERDPKVRDAVLRRANGKCEHCGVMGFLKSDGSRYLETHHVIALANDGADRLTNVIALCQNDHREAHFGQR